MSEYMDAVKIIQIVPYQNGFIGLDDDGYFYRGEYKEYTQTISDSYSSAVVPKREKVSEFVWFPISSSVKYPKD